MSQAGCISLSNAFRRHCSKFKVPNRKNTLESNQRKLKMSLEHHNFYIFSNYLGQSTSNGLSDMSDNKTGTHSNLNNEFVPFIIDHEFEDLDQNQEEHDQDQDQQEDQQVQLEQMERTRRSTQVSHDQFDWVDRPSSVATEQDETAMAAVRYMFRNDPTLHQDILNYVGTRPMEEKIFMADSDLVPDCAVQLVTILCFWLVNCGLCCIVCAIVGMTTTRFSYTGHLMLLKKINLKLSWISIWMCGVALIMLNFVMINCALWLPLCCKCFKSKTNRFRRSPKFD